MNRAAPAKRRRMKIQSRRPKQVREWLLSASEGINVSGFFWLVIFNLKRGLACRQEQALGVGEQQRDGHLHQHHRVSAHQPHKPGDDPHFSAQEGTAGWEGGVSSRATASGWREREKSRKSRKTSSPSPSRLFFRGQFLASLWLGINRTFRAAHK